MSNSSTAVYPRKCEVWMNVQTGAGFLVPVDARNKILKLYTDKYKDIQKVDEFEATSRVDMMTQYYKSMKWGTYTDPAMDRQKSAEKQQAKTTPAHSYKHGESTTTHHSSGTSTTYYGNKAGTGGTAHGGHRTTYAKQTALDVLEEALESVPDPSIYRRGRTLVHEIGIPKERFDI